MVLVSNKDTNSNYLEHRTQCILLFFHLSASRLSKLALFSYHKPLETPWFKNAFLAWVFGNTISQLLSFGGRRWHLHSYTLKTSYPAGSQAGLTEGRQKQCKTFFLPRCFTPTIAVTLGKMTYALQRALSLSITPVCWFRQVARRVTHSLCIHAKSSSWPRKLICCWPSQPSPSTALCDGGCLELQRWELCHRGNVRALLTGRGTGKGKKRDCHPTRNIFL